MKSQSIYLLWFFAATALKLNEVLRDLFLADNKLMPSDGIHLASLLRFNHKLKLLDVRNNQLGVRTYLFYVENSYF